MLEIQEKLCPFFNDVCKREMCMMWKPQVGDCALPIMAYNTWKLTDEMYRTRTERRNT
jgi:hypothetical protein